MTDLELIDLLASRLEAGLVLRGWDLAGYVVVQKPQMTQEAPPVEPTVFFQKLFDQPRGWAGAFDRYNETDGDFDHTEEQLVDTTFQISAFVPQDVTNVTMPTASDVVNFLKMYIQSRHTIALWQQSNVGQMRVSDVRNQTFEDDKTLFEFNPNFDLVLQHNSSITLKTPRVDFVVGTPSPIPGDSTKGVFHVRDEV